MKINPKLKLTLYVVVQINFILVSFVLYLLSYITIHKKSEDNVELQQVERWLSTQPFNCCELWMHFTHRIEFVRKYFLFLNSIHLSVFVFLSSLQWCVFTWGWGHHSTLRNVFQMETEILWYKLHTIPSSGCPVTRQIVGVAGILRGRKRGRKGEGIGDGEGKLRGGERDHLL